MDEAPSIWDQIVVDRREPSAPFRQIANAIRHRIATHQLAPNTPLPSVRKLAEQVGVTSATVGRAYRQLQNDGLVESRVGVGTVVTDTQRLVYHARQRSAEELEEALDDAITPLLGMGYSPAEIREAVERRLVVPAGKHKALIVSDAPAILEKYTQILGSEFSPLGIAVEGLTLDELCACTPPTRALLDDVVRVLTALSLHRSVREALEACKAKVPISIIFTELKLTTIERLSAIPKDARVLIVVEERYRNSVLGLLRQHAPHENISTARKLTPKSIRAGLAKCSVVVHSLGTRDLVQAEVGAEHDVILLDYQVRLDALVKLRESLASEFPVEST